MRAKAVERWRPVVGYEGLYSVSDRGKIRHEPMPGRHKKAHILSPGINSNGYRIVALCRKNRSQRARLHSLVCTAFNGPRPPGYQCNHDDGNKQNNFATNLEWLTRKANVRHAYDVLKIKNHQGEKNANAKLTDDDVRAMRRRYRKGISDAKELSAVFGVSRYHVLKIVTGIQWSHVA